MQYIVLAVNSGQLVRNYGGAELLHRVVKAAENVHVLETDINNIPGLEAAVKKVEDVVGKQGLDYLINNAAYANEGSRRNMTDFSDQVLVDAIVEKTRVNVAGAALTIKKFLPLLEAGKTKKVITVSSGLGDPELIKAAVVMVNQLYASQFKDFIFLAISPGVVATKDGPQDPEAAKLKGLMSSFQKYAPDFKGPITPTESVGLMLDIFANLKPEDSGAFISHKGNNEWL